MKQWNKMDLYCYLLSSFTFLPQNAVFKMELCLGFNNYKGIGVLEKARN